MYEGLLSGGSSLVEHPFFEDLLCFALFYFRHSLTMYLPQAVFKFA